MTLVRCLDILLACAIADDDGSSSVALAAIAEYDSASPMQPEARTRRLERLDVAFRSRTEPTFVSLLIQMEIASLVETSRRQLSGSGTTFTAEQCGGAARAPAEHPACPADPASRRIKGAT